MRRRLISIILLAAITLTACSHPFGSKKVEVKEDIDYSIKAVTANDLTENMFYVKSGDDFYKVHMGETNIEEKNLIAKKAGPERIISFTKDDEMIPTLYKDDSLIYYTKSEIPSFTWERMKDNDYTVGMYNLKAAESGKIEFVVGESKTDHGSAVYKGLSKIAIENAVIIIDKIGGQSMTEKNLSDCGSIIGLKPDEAANLDLYIGTQHYNIESTVDTHVLSSMELYQTTEYNLMKEGYASVKIPDYFMSGYYFVNGVGVIKYVANNRSEGIANVDFSIPYFYKDKSGKQYTLPEWNVLNGIDHNDTEKTADYNFTYNIDSTVKAFTLSLTYDLTKEESDNSLLLKPTAVITSPLGEETILEAKKQNGKQEFVTTIDGVTSGAWKIEIFDLGERKFNVDMAIETGNADSFVHSGKNSGRFTIHSDGINGPALASVKWENTTHAANIEIKSPSGLKRDDKNNANLLLEDGYGKKTMLLDSAEAGNWELTITGEDLGRCWFNIIKQEQVSEVTE